MNWYQIVLLLVTTVCIGAPMLYAFGIKEKEMHPNVKEIHDIQALRIENAKLRKQVKQLLVEWESERDYADQMEAKEMKAVAENAKLRELVRGLHMAYVGAINKCESLDEALIWEFSGNIDDDVAKSKEEYESERHRFDVAMRELGVTDD